jgi:hypothetical protein
MSGVVQYSNNLTLIWRVKVAFVDTANFVELQRYGRDPKLVVNTQWLFKEFLGAPKATGI